MTGEEALARHFPGGGGRPVTVIGNQERATQIRAALIRTPVITGVTQGVQRDGPVLFDGTLRAAPDSPEAERRVRRAVHAVPGPGAKVAA